MNIMFAYPTGKQELASGCTDLDIIRTIMLEAKSQLITDHVRFDMIGTKDVNLVWCKRNSYYQGMEIALVIRFSFSTLASSLRGGRVFYQSHASPQLANRATGYLRKAGLMMMPPLPAIRDPGHLFLDTFCTPALNICLGNGKNKSDLWEIGDGQDVAKAICRLVGYRKALRMGV